MRQRSILAGVVALGAALASALALAAPASASSPPYGGDSIRNDSYYCTAGVPVRSNSGQWYLVTAGHCTVARWTGTWEDVPNGPLPIGNSVRGAFGNLGPDGAPQGQDIGAIISSKPLSPSQVKSSAAVYTLTGMRDPAQGEQVCFAGGESHRTYCGHVTTQNTNQLSTAPGLGTQRIYNLAAITLNSGVSCPAAGDSGAPGLVGTVATGVLSGCDASRRLMFEAKIGGVVSSWGLHL